MGGSISGVHTAQTLMYNDKAENEIWIDFGAALKCEITGSENNARHIRNTSNLFISSKGLNFSFEIPMIMNIIKKIVFT
jgi:hypothetical protein